MTDGLKIAVLAAGSGSRFGGDKLDADLLGKPIGQWVLDAVEQAGLPPGMIVAGPEVPGFALTSGWTLIGNPRAEDGLGTSLAIAAAHAQDRLLVLLADMPLVDADYLSRLSAVEGVAATRHPGGRVGVPAVFDRSMLSLLADLDGDRGAAGLLAKRKDLTLFDVPPEMLLDIDTPEDLSRAEAILRRA